MVVALRAFVCSAFQSHLFYEDESNLYRLWVTAGMFLMCLLLYHFMWDDQIFLPVMKIFSAMCTLFYLMWNRKKRIVDDHLDKDDSTKDSPVVLEQPKKQNRKSKRKKNNKAKVTDDANDGSSKSVACQKTEYGTQERTKLYTPLKLYVGLNLKKNVLYEEFKYNVSTEEQLRRNGFPQDYPGRVTSNKKLPEVPNERHCCRCGGTFYVMNDGQYESSSTCHYHTKKLTQCYNVPGALIYECCKGDFKAEGCNFWLYHVTAENFTNNVEFVKVREKRHLNSDQACTVYGLDCEMCYTTGGLEVTKIGVVSIDGLTIYETFVLPEKKILDYNTVYSGVTANDLKGVSTTLMDVQAFLLKLLNKESILVGHGLENDLKALRLIHENIVDTSIVFPHKHGLRYKRSLKSLAAEYLSKTIQDSDHGHDCIEDARTCMELMLWKIDSDLKHRPPVVQDENRNSILQNLNRPDILRPVYAAPSINTCLRYCGNMYRESDFRAGYLFPAEDLTTRFCVY